MEKYVAGESAVRYSPMRFPFRIDPTRMPTLPNPVKAGLLFAAGGLAVSLPISLLAVGSGWGWLAPGAAIATGILGCVAASLRAFTKRKRVGVMAGAAIGLLAHPLSWLIFVSLSLVADPVAGEQATTRLADAAASVPALSLFSLLLAGWLTAPLGAALGYLLASGGMRLGGEA